MSLRARIVVIAGQAATLLATWPLWAPRASGPPMLPLLDLPALDFAPLLLATLGLAALRPKAGAVMHAVLLALAIAADQTRLQPSTISLAILLLALAPARRTLAPAHLAALWFWAGAHKLLAPAFLTATAPAMFSGQPALGAALATTEITLGLLVLLPRARAITTYAALVLHAALAVGLIARGELALVPWNLVLACAGLFLPRERTRALDLALLIIPLGLYLNVTDAYVAHALYTGDVWRSVRCDPLGCESDEAQASTVAAFGVPLEPEPRLLRAHFEATCAPGEELFLTPPSFARPTRGLSCPQH